ncbi:MAG: hypothetical protein V4792_05230, partial [Pseudomonadota bacterium]
MIEYQIMESSMRSLIVNFSSLAALLLCGACATSTSLPTHIPATSTVPGGLPSGPLVIAATPGVVPVPVLVKITFPADITPAAMSEVERLYVQMNLGFNAPYGERTDPSGILSILTKSSYLAHEFHRTLGRSVSPTSIVLSPAVIDINNGVLIYREKGTVLPAALTVDMLAFVPSKSFWGLPQSGTIGRVSAPLFEVRSGGSST